VSRRWVCAVRVCYAQGFHVLSTSFDGSDLHCLWLIAIKISSGSDVFSDSETRSCIVTYVEACLSFVIEGSPTAEFILLSLT
jgi:hypothetical protein